MSGKREARAFKVGLFTLIAIGLGIGAVVALGAGSFGRPKILIETYFDESVHGLSVGSAVKLRGVKIGSIKQVSFTRNYYRIDPNDAASKEWTKHVLVVAAIQPDAFPEAQNRSIEALIEEQIRQGLRMQLALEGISGLLYLEANYWPDLIDEIPEPPWLAEHYYVPARSSRITQLSEALAEFFKKVDSIDIEGIASDVQTLLRTSSELVADLDTETLQANITDLLHDLRYAAELLRGFLEDADSQRLVENVGATLDDTRRMLVRIEEVVAGESVRSVLANLESFTGDLPGIAVRADQGLAHFDGVVADQGRELAELLRRLGAVTSQLDRLLGGLRGHPSSALFGAPPPPSRPYQRDR